MLIGENYEHVMGRADLESDASGLKIIISVDPEQSRTILELFELDALYAVSFVGIPLTPKQNITTKENEKS